ncbi:MAG: C-terminal binding protein [Ancalomicrobiaceae bacterium]|nr:C-terminal binding protein [Ancalomicrobiaceae bacterium]
MKVVVSDCDHKSMAPEEKVFADNGMAFDHLRCVSEDDVIRRCKGADIILNQYAPFTEQVFAALKPELRQIVRYGVGVNNVDLSAATAAGVQVCNVPDYGVGEVSDQALAMVIALARKLVPMNRLTHAGTWDYQHAIPIRRMADQIVGVIGIGRIGRAFSHKARGLGCRVIGTDPAYRPGSPEIAGVEWMPFERVIAEADFVSIHCPLTAETHHMFDAAALALMKPTACLVNTARGGIVDEAALADALAKGALAGAALDVTEGEPLAADSPLRGLDTCLLTPHMAWYSEEAGQELKRKVAEEAVRFALGTGIKYPVNALR